MRCIYTVVGGVVVGVCWSRRPEEVDGLTDGLDCFAIVDAFSSQTVPVLFAHLNDLMLQGRCSLDETNRLSQHL